MADWQFPIIALLLLDDVCGGSRRSQVHSRYRKDFLTSLDIIGRWLRSRKIPRSCLQDPSVSAWRKLYGANNDQGMITLTALTVLLLCLFVRYLHQSSILTHPLFLLGHHALNGRN